MRKRTLVSLQLLLCLLFNINIFSQEDTTKFNSETISSKYLGSVNNRAEKLNAAIDETTEKYLSNLSKDEQKISRSLYSIDSTAAKAIGTISARYEELSTKLIAADGKLSKLFAGEYLARLDSLQGVLSFLKGNQQLLAQSKNVQQQLEKSLDEVRLLQDKLNQAEYIKAFIQERQEQIKQILSKYTNLPNEVSRYFGKYQQQVYYFGEQLREYKESLHDPDKMEQKVLVLLNRVPAFRDFISRNSLLAGIFAPVNNTSSAIDPSLPTRAQVQQMLGRSAIGNGSNGQQYITQQIQQAQDQLNKIKDKLNQLGGASTGDLNVPPFKPNNQKIKSFTQRIELGFNLQSGRNSSYFPVMTDFGWSAGYKLNDKSIIGIGGSYKLGWGANWNHIHFSSQGVGFRSFVDLKIRGGLWLTGGAELNYYTAVSSLQIFKDYTLWQKAALLGLSKKYSVGKKFKGNAQFLYDFLHNHHMPRTQPLLFRVGYNF